MKRQDKIYFPSFDSPIDNKGCEYSFEDGFVLGWNLGDGWTSYHKRHKSKQYGFIFSQEDVDFKIGERVLNYTNNLAQKNSSLRQDHNSNSYTYCTSDKAVINSFEEKGLSVKKLISASFNVSFVIPALSNITGVMTTSSGFTLLAMFCLLLANFASVSAVLPNALALVISLRNFFKSFLICFLSF